MLTRIINFSIKNKFIIGLFILLLIVFGLFSATRISIGAVPDITNNQVQILTTTRNLSTADVEKFITYQIELEMANLPGVVEIRSVSKFGLSVVTVVFDDDMGTYLPRQLIAEKIKQAAEKIPQGFGVPEMGPISTGLGEIYQYILDVEPAYKDRYTATDLRTIQDWIVRRQLSGIPGVVEVNTWGGFLKQYEIAINSNQLNAMNISFSEVFSALENNNSVAGSGYIEKVNQAYFIRGEGLIESLNDIENIVVNNINNTPVYIKDVAKVQYGSAVRFGAITGNGEGEKVLGQVMMLKGANSKQVIDAVKERIEQIEGSLPQGVFINGFLDRSELIGKTTFTIVENLTIGCLIVIFVLVLLLGNWRSGLVIASIIPLSMLFTLSLMYLFKVDANLMSLGAIDFGIIIDGAVIIVEFVSFQMTRKGQAFNLLPNSERQDFRDKITIAGASKMMNSAVFGQLIIIIVFIPILALSGVEGKMFKPMALTFSFALLGAMILCFTYVPVMTSLFVNPSRPTKLSNLATKLNDWLYHLYQPIIFKALVYKKLVLAAAFSLLLLSALLFNSMGGEFVPTLDEGDFVIQPVLKTGTSLGKTVEITTQIERILKKEFPDEVNQIVSRIGAAEVPTDPMSMEESDVIITLHPRGQWTKAGSKDELADKFKEALEVLSIPELEFTQPIEMRFNELITGVRADVAIKVFGEDLDILVHKGEEIKKLIQNVEGAADITVEKIEGLPQISVIYNRQKIARYGLNISQVNDVLAMAIAGKTLGTVFEGEKQFDMVVRLDEHHRTDIKDIKNLYLDTPSGNKIPLSELADISYQKGPAKISRDDTKRRMVVGVMVRNRDLQSVVDDIQEILNSQLKLPVGYTITYGGQFENLQSAIARLKIAVPVALFLIFVVLYFAFGSVKDALMIFSAIPLAAIGGVLLLWLRDLPFSISAGIGFIALFGVAVLNGIMLIEHFKTLKEEQNFKTMDALVKQGTKDRFRAIMLTASSTALGFLPMAVSVNVGAEVQRPLATVVIGGLITSTLLTLVVLPILYTYFDQWEFRVPRLKSGTRALLLLICLGSFSVGTAQNSPKNLEALIVLATENNSALKSEAFKLEQSNALKGTAYDFEKTNIYYGFDENNIAENGQAIKVFGIQQNFLFPTVYSASKKLLNKQYELKTSQYEVANKSVKRAVTSAYYHYVTAYNKATIYKGLDSLYTNFAKNAKRRFELGDTNYLESITANSKQRQIQIAYEQSRIDIGIWYEKLHKLVQTEDSLLVALPLQTQLDLVVLDIEQEPEVAMFKSSLDVKTAENKLEKNKLLPDITLEYFQGTNDLLSGYLYGYQVGLKIPILFGAQSSKVKASKIAISAMEAGLKDVQFQMNSRRNALEKELLKYAQHIAYYQKQGQALSEAILKTAESSYKNGEIDFFQYIISLENAFQIKLDYLDQLNNYNQIVIQLNYLSI